MDKECRSGNLTGILYHIVGILELIYVVELEGVKIEVHPG